jgi:hypothetical protein
MIIYADTWEELVAYFKKPSTWRDLHDLDLEIVQFNAPDKSVTLRYKDESFLKSLETKQDAGPYLH